MLHIQISTDPTEFDQKTAMLETQAILLQLKNRTDAQPVAAFANCASPLTLLRGSNKLKVRC